MRTIITGSRTITNTGVVAKAVAGAGWEVTRVISGGSDGVDETAERWAKDNEIPCDRFPAKQAMHARAAGIRRNDELAHHADALIAIWDGKSKGAKNMIVIAKNRGLKVHEVRIASR